MADNQAGDVFRKGSLGFQDSTLQRDNEAWGGHGYGRVKGPDGGTYSSGSNGYDEDVDRYKGLAANAAVAGAVRLDWNQANQDRDMADGARNAQRDAMGRVRGIADGSTWTPAQESGRQQLQAGLQAQQAGAMSARGGSLAQAAAMQQQQNGAAAYTQGGNQQLDAQHAQEMAAARSQYMGMASQTRDQDQLNQGILQQRGDAEAQAEQAGRDLNDSTSMGYEHMGQDVENQRLKQATTADALGKNHESVRSAADQADQDRKRKEIAAYTSSASTVLGYAGSDETMKQGVRGLGAAASAYDNARVADLSEPAGMERHFDRDVSASAPTASTGASLSGPTPRFSKGERAMSPPKAEAKAKTHKYTDAELEKIGREMQGNVAAQSSQLGAGPAVQDPMTRALADMKPYEYSYRPQYAGDEGQAPDERNVGPMAQDMARNPITGSAVVRRPDGKLAVDMTKAGKLSLAAVGHLAARQQEQDREIAMLKGGR